MRRSLILTLALALAACSRSPATPAPLDTKNDACAFCRMSVSNAGFAAQLVAPGEEPKFFDDVGCLRDYLAAKRVAGRAVCYVADHRTKAWVVAAAATYSICPALDTPMASHLLAHADTASRDRDPDVQRCAPATIGSVFGATGPPDGRSR